MRETDAPAELVSGSRKTGVGAHPVPTLYSIVMPAYNEEAVIDATLRDLTSHLDGTGFAYEIVVVDDGSRDRTHDILVALAAGHPAIRPVQNPGPGGYGFAIRKGLQHYRGDAVVVVTADGADAPKDVAAYFAKMAEGYDCVFGSRFGKDSTVTGYPPVKRAVNRVANWLLSWIVGHRYRDFTNGFKCYRRHVIDDMQPLVSGQFNITIEMSLKAVLAGWTYAVVPNDWSERDAGKSSFRLLRLVKPYATTMLYCLSRAYLLKVRR
jgi:dolichol-phosphate mannosyltransferase